jgi:hypothetical protein
MAKKKGGKGKTKTVYAGAPRSKSQLVGSTAGEAIGNADEVPSHPNAPRVASSKGGRRKGKGKGRGKMRVTKM